jgi:hypothetical protein
MSDLLESLLQRLEDEQWKVLCAHSSATDEVRASWRAWRRKLDAEPNEFANTYFVWLSAQVSAFSSLTEFVPFWIYWYRLSGHLIPWPPYLEPPALKFSEDVGSAYSGIDTPLSRLQHERKRQGVNWGTDAQCPVKAYICACLAELAYHDLGQYDLKARNRYKIIPSIALEALRGYGEEIDLSNLAMLGGEITVNSQTIGPFVYAVYQFYSFNVVAVRGTRMLYLVDWFIDLNARKYRVGDRVFHRGFYLEAGHAAPKLKEMIHNPDVPLYFTGHSLGGAVANVLPEYWRDSKNIMTPYLFAAPRIGDQAALDSLPAYPYIRQGDPVPHMPLLRMGFSDHPNVTLVQHKRDNGSHLGKEWPVHVGQHSMEWYRSMLGEHVLSKTFAPEIYIDALQKRLGVPSN